MSYKSGFANIGQSTLLYVDALGANESKNASRLGWIGNFSALRI
jgi:hypothetical protein